MNSPTSAQIKSFRLSLGIMQNPRVAIYTMQHLKELFNPAQYAAWVKNAKLEAFKEGLSCVYLSPAGDIHIIDQDAFTKFLETYKE